MIYRRIVIKVGSHVLTEDGKVAKDRMMALVELIAKLKSINTDVVLVSSGAVAAGYTQLPLDRDVISNRQALAAIGQPLLLGMYQEKFAKHGILCSQVLFSSDVFDSRKHTAHAKNAIDTLLQNDVVPIINENDTVSIEELVFGDNDRLSAHVAHYFDAELLVILSDIDAYYDKDPNRYSDAKTKSTVNRISDDELKAEHTPSSKFATGGIVTKLQSAKFLMSHGKEMYLASGFNLNNAKSFLIDGVQTGGTLFKNS
ncbi:Glutamate 5-kinase [hydrothermal vent metagenome]|uniref:Glutamate 5-kinase n=1 Tax=hydrothermal vent metagenome TaxID=652676 RepID=A0A1W1CEL3_9ZZZZ